MCRSIIYRLRHLVGLWREGLIATWLALAYALAGLFVFVRDEIWRPSDDSDWRIIKLIPHLSLAWWLFGGAVVFIVWLFESSFRMTQRLQDKYGLWEGELPLAIIFDPVNTNRKFWSLEPNRDENGKQVAGSFWEYRAVIKNQTHRTIRNVKVIVEAIGPLPARPIQSMFDIDRRLIRDLSPQEEALAIIRTWYNPVIVQGMVCGEDAYGPIKMTVLADDVPPSTKLFHFDPEKMPAVYE
jgi:hypothetical protein